MSVKIIVTNMSALTAKYGAGGAGTIQAALTPMVAADRARGIVTTVVDLSDPSQMAVLNAPVVTSAADEQQNKTSIDAVYRNTNPNFLMILGAPDVVPHQSLTNPIRGGADSDPDVPSDLPYACEAPYGRAPGAFTGPTRIVGRLPDVYASNDAAYLARLIQFAISVRPQNRARYLQYFGLSTQAWQASTRLSLTNLFGGAASMWQSPPSGPSWTDAQLAPLSHFVNCHGGNDNPTWYGDDGAGSQPPAISAPGVLQCLTPGTIAAAECCYGAQLYAAPVPGALSLCNTYLLSGALSFFGSTNIAYGPASGNSNADLITQYMLSAMLNAGTAGAATLSARQRFVTQAGGALSPVNLKTLAQFVLLGDPSLAPVAPVTPAAALDDDALEAEREAAERVGRHLARNVAVPIGDGNAVRAPEIDARLQDEARRRGHGDLPLSITTYDSEWRGDDAQRDALPALPRFHIATLRRTTDLRPPRGIVLVAREELGQILSIEENWQRG